MEILERKSLPKPQAWSLKVTCKKCRSRLKILESDIKMAGYGGYAAFAEEIRPTFDCPACKKTNCLPNEKVPEQYRTKYGDGFSRAWSSIPVE